jgi:sugar/nucleoside kinase (ribokinase family)
LEKKDVRIVDQNADGIEDLVMDFGTKLPVKKLTRLAAVGNAANNAWGSARLGLKTAFYSHFGDDADSVDSQNVLKGIGVSDRYFVTEPGKKSNFSAVVNVGAERTILVYHTEWNYMLPEGMVAADWVYYTSVGHGYEKTGLDDQILEYCERTGTKLAYQPGSHQLRMGLEYNKKLIPKCDFLVMNREEAADLLGKPREQGCEVSVREFLGMGAKIVAVTDGPAGSHAGDGSGVWFQDIYDIEVVERTGCGDSYATAFTAAIQKGHDVKEAMKWGTVNAAGKLRFIGGREGQLTEAEIHEWLGRKPEFGPVPA